MKVEIIGKSLDLRTNTPVIYTKLSIPDYLALVGDSFTEFSIQRRREKHKAYERMKTDIIAGALLPSITLAVKIDRVSDFLPYIESFDEDVLSRKLEESGQVHILDGLQRTHILNDIQKENGSFKEGQTLLVEFWFEKDINNLIYRIIVLNAGQKPMSMRHQVELLFMSVKERLESQITNLEIFTERDQNRRTKPGKYALDRIAMAYQCFITKSPEVQRDNLVAQQLKEEDILASSEETLGEQFNNFTHYLKIFVQLDSEVCRIYQKASDDSIQSGVVWFGSENVMNSFFAAIADFGSNPDRIERVRSACNALLNNLKSAADGADPLGLLALQKITHGFNTRKVNVGNATRKLLTAGFKEYFRDEGETPLERCWINEAE